ncbi:MAG: FliA/WhiG family RNA polymerase sigma factor [Phycisphaerales bacterium]
MPIAKANSQSAPRKTSAKAKTANPKSDPAKTLPPRRLADVPVRELWEEYADNRNVDIRNHFMERFLPLVRYNAERIHTRLPDEVDVEDLMSAGLFGLIDAINSFDLSRGVKFETFCAPRIRGAILDHLRSMDWVPRLVRQRTAAVERARNAIQMETGHQPTEAQIAGRLGIDEKEFDKVRHDAKPVGMSSLNRRFFNSDSSREVREIDVVRDDAQDTPLADAQRTDLKDLITKGLSRAERLIVILYYYEEMTMKEIGRTLDLSESRVSQMHSSILARLKAHMQQREPEFEPAAF